MRRALAPEEGGRRSNAAAADSEPPLRGGQALRPAPKLEMAPWPAAASRVRESASDICDWTPRRSTFVYGDAKGLIKDALHLSL